MSGPAEDCFRVWLQQRKLEDPGDSTTKSLTVEMDSFAAAFNLNMKAQSRTSCLPVEP